MKKIAILLAAYNGKDWINEQIESIQTQEEIDAHIYISVDCSSDGTYEYLITEYSNDVRVTILPYGTRFGAAAPNFFRLIIEVPFEQYDFVALSDQDDIWMPDKVNSAVMMMEELGADGYSSNVIAFWPNGRRKMVIKATPQKQFDFLFEGPGPGCSFVLNNSLALEIKAYFTAHADKLRSLDWHDWVIYAFARSRSHIWHIDEKPHMLYRQHSSNQLGANSGPRQFVRRVNDILCGYGMLQSLLLIDFLQIGNSRFVRRWKKGLKISYLRLALRSNQCRRRKKDQALFFISCLIMALLRPRWMEHRK
jgi:rhamnosyltransferase